MFGGCKKIVLSCLAAMIGIVFVSCSSEQEGKHTLYTVQRGAFDDVLQVEGFTESMGSISLTCPPDVDGTIEYLIESGTMVKKGDTLCIIEDVSIEERYDDWQLSLENSYADLEATKANARMELALLEAQVKTNDAETLIAGLDSIQLLYLSPTERRIKEL